MLGARNYLEKTRLTVLAYGRRSVHAEDLERTVAVSVFVEEMPAGHGSRLEVVYRKAAEADSVRDPRFERRMATEISRVVAGTKLGAGAGLVAADGRKAAVWAQRRWRMDDAAIVIGVGDYRDLPAVAGAERDASAMRTAAVRLLGVIPDRIAYLSEGPITKTDIEKSVFEWLPVHMSSASRVYLYFSGHARRTKDGVLRLMPWDADPDHPEFTGASIVELSRKALSSGVGEVVIFLDSCDGLADGDGFSGPNERVTVFTAASPGQSAVSRPGAGNGAFTERLLRGLSGEAARSGIVTAGSLADYLGRGAIGDGCGGQTSCFRGDPSSILAPLAETPLSGDLRPSLP